MSTLQFIKFNFDFLDAIDFESLGIEDFDEFCKTSVKNFLYGKNTYLTTFSSNEEIQKYITDIKSVYSNFIRTCKQSFLSAKEILQGKTTTRQNQTISHYGNENVSGSYFEPLKDGEQARVKTNGSLTEWDDDTTTNNETTTESAIDDSVLINALNEITKKVETTFIEFVNIFA